MDFSLTDEQIKICESIKELCKRKLNENIFKDDENSEFPKQKWIECGKFGIHGLPVPEEYGGLGQSMLNTALGIKSLAYGCKDEGLVFSICAHMLTCIVPIWHFGTEEQKMKYLPQLCTGEFIGGNGITEADSGSDIKSMCTSITRDGNQFVINGSKIFVSNGPIADMVIIYAKHPGGLPMLDTSAVIIEKGNPGMKVGQIFKKMGLRTCTIGEIILDNCKVPEQNIVGRERLGMKVFNHSMLWERIIMSAYHTGAMEQQYELVLEYAKSRKQYGQAISSFQSISDKLVSMKMRIENTKLMLYKVCWCYDNNKEDIADASMLKLLSSESKVQNSLDAVQTFGAYGYMKESMVEKQLRDSIASKIYSGTSEIQKKIIAESLGKIHD